MKLIVGLGNPGIKYENTRHNVGFMTLDCMATRLNLEFNKKKFNGIYFETYINGEKVIFLKPQKYINLSGEVIKSYINYFKINIKDMLVIHDELDLDLGTLRLKISGGNAGHNGLKNIDINLNTNEYKRLRIGISDDKTQDSVDYVLPGDMFRVANGSLWNYYLVRAVTKPTGDPGNRVSTTTPPVFLGSW